MVDVFISYSRANQALVRRLAEAVKRLGYSTWWDDELPPHLSYGDVITEKIGQAKAAIVVWSEDAAASEWVRAEADVARNQKKLIQTSIDGRMPPMPFNQIQFAAIGDWQGEEDHPGWIKVKASLEALCGTPGVAAPLPAAAPPALSAPPAAMPAAAPAPAPGGGLLVPALLGLLVLAVLLVGFVLWSRGDGGRPTTEDAPATVPAPAAPAQQQAEAPRPAGAKPPAPAAEAATGRPAARAVEASAPRAPARASKPAAGAAQPIVLQMPMNPRRYCMGPGRGTAECEQLRARFARQRPMRGGYR